MRCTARGLAIGCVVAVVGAACTSGSGPAATTRPSSATDAAGTGGGTVPDVVTVPDVSVPFPTPPVAPWTVDVEGCDDPAAATAELTGMVTIGTVAPLSGGLISVIYAPVVEGIRAYIDAANEQQLLDGVELKLVEADDEGNPALTPVAVSGLLDSGVEVIAGTIGSANSLAARDQVNARCIPQLMALGNSPLLGDVVAAPWTMGGLVPVTVETTVYVDSIVRSVGGEATVGLLVADDSNGVSYAESFRDAAALTDLEIVTEQTVPAASIDPPSTALLRLADKRPQVLMVSLSGAACATFLTELDKVRFVLPDWTPAVYVSSGCADPSILSLAGSASDGVFTSANLAATHADFVQAMAARGVSRGLSAAAEGWTAAEVTVAILIAAQKSPGGLSRKSIIEAARHLSYVPSLARPGVRFTTNGVDDPFPAESLQIVRFDAANQSFIDVGPLIAQFES